MPGDIYRFVFRPQLPKAEVEASVNAGVKVQRLAGGSDDGGKVQRTTVHYGLGNWRMLSTGGWLRWG